MNPFRNKASFYAEKLVTPRQPPSWSLTPCRLPATTYSIYSQQRRIFGPKGEDITDEWIKLYNEMLNDLYCPPNIVWVIKSIIMRWAVHVACMGRGEIHTGFWRVNLREGTTCKTQEADRRIILRRIIRKWDLGVWTGLIWLRIGTGCGHL
jgi:hypothetical protein